MQFLLLFLALLGLASKTLGANFDVASSTALTASSGARIIGASADDLSGWSVAPAGDINQDGITDLIIGAPSHSPSGRATAGAAYVVYGKKDASMLEIDLAALDKTTGIKIIGAVTNDQLGQSVAAAGDINQDGVDDVIIGAPYFDLPAGTDAGAAYVIYGKKGGMSNLVIDVTNLDQTTGIKIIGAAASTNAGWSVAGGGDINQDGVDDVIIAAPGSSGPGEAYVVYGKKNGMPNLEINLANLDKSTGIKMTGVASSRLGNSVAAAGDINQDGVDDFIVGANYYSSSGPSYAGAAYVIYGKKNGMPNLEINLASLDISTGIRIIGAQQNDQLGFSVAAAGDFNKDGVDDVVVGSPYATSKTGREQSGKAYIIYGRKGGMPLVDIDVTRLDTSTGVRILGTAANENLGMSLASGDFNKDGVNDVIFGARASSPSGRLSAGAAYIIYGKKNGMSTVEIDMANSDIPPGIKIIGAARDDQLGDAVAAGDFNQDGGMDIIVGSLQYSPTGRSSAGATYVIYGWKGSYGCDQWTSPSTCQVCSAGNVLYAADGQCYDPLNMPQNTKQNTNTESTSSTNIGLIVGVTLGSAGTVVLAGLFYYFLKRRALSVRRIRVLPQSPAFQTNSPASADLERSPMK